MTMRTRQAGFTLVELLIVSVLTAVTLAGIYQTLIVQEKSYEAATLKIHDQESLRTAIGILEAELREVGSIGGDSIGGSDIEYAGTDSIMFRAQRKIGFICTLSAGPQQMIVWALGDTFEGGDALLVFVDGDSLSSADDAWDTMTVTDVQTSTNTTCLAAWPNTPLELLTVSGDTTGVRAGSPVRAYEWVSYSLHNFGPLGYGLARWRAGATDPDYLIGGLAGDGEGLQFQYYTTDGSTTDDPTQISRVRITIRTDPPGNSGVEPLQLSTNLFLRNN